MNIILTFLNLFLIFFIYSTLGWILESLYVSIRYKKVANRGFLIGPYCPIYGCGSILIILYLNQYKNNAITIFLLGLLLCSILEYITSYLMEKIFKARWWDYSDKLFNLNGRVCGENALLFGLGSVFIIYILNPIINKFLSLFPPISLHILSIIFLIIFITDTISSFEIIKKLKRNIKDIDININKDSTEELKIIVARTINNKIERRKAQISIFQKRIIKAFPYLDLNNFINGNKKKKLTKNS